MIINSHNIFDTKPKQFSFKKGQPKKRSKTWASEIIGFFGNSPKSENGGICGCDAGKKIKGRKRHIVTGTCGFLAGVGNHAADLQDRGGAPQVTEGSQKTSKRPSPAQQHGSSPGPSS